jgi:hypothetical protein
MRTTFVMMYWPSRVGANGEIVKVSRGNRMSGMKVPTIWRASSRSVAPKEPRRERSDADQALPRRQHG